MSLLKSTLWNPQSVVAAHVVTINRIIRRMRGGSQSWLVQCDDDRFYVAKLLGNPQGRRTLINELLVYTFITRLNVLTPRLSLLHLPEDLAQATELYFLVGNKRVRPEGRLHLGSQVPVNPDKTTIFDFLPDKLLSRISNKCDFATMFVLGIWCYQTDSGQAIFIRNNSSRDTPYNAYFIDHGLCFDGMHWDLRDAPLHGLGIHKKVYSQINMRCLTEEAVSSVQRISEEILLASTGTIPSTWLAPGDRECLDTLLDRLLKRQLTLPLMVTRHLDYLGF
jgi:hypothetical protein